jgi:hypothetical protein
MASAIARAQPAPSADPAIEAATAAEQKVGQLANQRAQLEARYQAEVTAIERLKNEKPSWRRDRELSQSMADSKPTADRLTTLDQQIAGAADALAVARRAELSAIDSELAAGASGPRADHLRKLRAQLAPQARAPKKIVIPDAEVDPAADPEELEQQAAQIRATEQALAAQAAGLEHQAKELASNAEVLKHHQRANELARRDDDQPVRAAQTGTLGARDPGHDTGIGNGAGANNNPNQNPNTGMGAGSGGGSNEVFAGGDKTAFESEAAIVLGDAIDQHTIDGLARASRSGDPGQRAEAARKASEAVRSKLELLRKKRSLIEQRAKQLRR